MTQTFLKLTFAALLGAAAIATGPAVAQEPGNLDIRHIAVTGEGVIRARPDMATLSLGVTSEAADAKAALAANTESMTRIIDALKADGIESRDIQTSGFMVEPRYSQPPQEPRPDQSWQPQIVGYVVRNTVTLRIRDLNAMGTILDRVVTLGSNSISGPFFGVQDPANLENSARSAAVRDARAKAELYAEAAGVKLGPVLRLTEQTFMPPQPMMMDRAMKAEAASAPVPIESGELTVQAQVQVTWGLE